MFFIFLFYFFIYNLLFILIHFTIFFPQWSISRNIAKQMNVIYRYDMVLCWVLFFQGLIHKSNHSDRWWRFSQKFNNFVCIFLQLLLYCSSEWALSLLKVVFMLKHGYNRTKIFQDHLQVIAKFSQISSAKISL